MKRNIYIYIFFFEKLHDEEGKTRRKNLWEGKNEKTTSQMKSRQLNERMVSFFVRGWFYNRFV